MPSPLPAKQEPGSGEALLKDGNDSKPLVDPSVQPFPIYHGSCPFLPCHNWHGLAGMLTLDLDGTVRRPQPRWYGKPRWYGG